jgi:hypothetical protein
MPSEHPREIAINVALPSSCLLDLDKNVSREVVWEARMVAKILPGRSNFDLGSPTGERHAVRLAADLK